MPTSIAARTLSLSDLRSLTDVEEPALAPDGSRIAVITIRNDRNALLIVNVRSGTKRKLVDGQSVAVPRWSPDGTRLAFLKEDRNGTLQLFCYEKSGVMRQLTHVSGRVADFAWSRAGDRIALAINDSPSSQPFLEAGDNDYTLGANVSPEHLWVMRSDGTSLRRLTSGSWTVAPTDPGGMFTSQFAWNAGDKRITFVRLPNTASGDNEYSTLWDVDVATGALHKLTHRTAFESAPQPSPGNVGTLYAFPRGGNYLANNTLRILRSDGTSWDLTARFDWDAGGALWMQTGKSLLVCANEHTRVGTWLFNLHGGMRALPLGGLNIACDAYQDSEYDAGIAASVSRSGAIAFVGSDSRKARELYYLSSPNGVPRRLTRFNDFVEKLQLGTQREISWRSTDGFTDYGVLTFPPNMVAGRRYPIVVNIHGGPGTSSVRDFAPNPVWPRPQLIASHGYIVFEPNYRGSDDAGNAFLLAIVGNTVRGPSDDIVSGLRAVQRLPQADPNRVGVCGWSYGGLLTSWLITQYHDWRAAVSGAAVDNELEEYAFSESNVQDRYYQGTSPYAPGGESVYRRNSPLTYAGAVTTPTLMWGTNFDPVVPISQQYEFYHALREHHVPVRFVVFPSSTHGPAGERQREVLTRLWLNWLDRFIRA